MGPPAVSVRLPSAVWLVCAVLAWPAAGGEAAPDADPEQLIRTLEKGDFDQRQEAARKLEALGDKARHALERAARDSETYEVRAIAERIVNGLSQASVRIQVVDTQGRPVADMPLQIQDWQPTPPRSALIRSGADDEQPAAPHTDGNGQLVLPGLTPGSLVGCTAESAPGEKWADAAWYVRPGENKLVLPLHRGGTVAGSLATADDGKPLANAAVFLVLDWGQDVLGLDPQKTLFRQHEDRPGPTAVSDAAGRFTLEHVAEGGYLLFAQHEDCAVTFGGPVRVCEGGRTELPAPLKLPRRAAAYGTLKVQLLDEKGQPLSKANVAVTVGRTPAPSGSPEGRATAALQAWFRYSTSVSDKTDAIRQATTDGDGYLELKDLWPGVYRVAVGAEQEGKTEARTYLLRNVAVSAGQTAAPPKQKPLACGSIAGELKTAGSRFSSRFIFSALDTYECTVWALAEDDPEATALLSDVTRHEHWFGLWRDHHPDFCVEQNDGKFALKDLPPGRYTVVIVGGVAAKGVIHDVEVAAGKETKLPAFALPGYDRPPQQRAAAKAGISGRVLLPDGQPAKEAQVALLTERGSNSQTMCSEKGTFSFAEGSEEDKPQRLVVSLPGFRARHVDLTPLGLPLQGLTLHLEKEAYGSLAVTVCDPGGRPLSGAVVTMQLAANARYYVSNNGGANQAPATDKAGRTLLRGLAFGPRRLEAVRDGYYLPEPVEVVVVPDTATPVKVTLQRGLTLTGRVEAPAGADTTKGMVYLEYPSPENPYGYGSRQCFAAAVDASGRFEVGGLRPGKATLFALYPGLLLAQDKVEAELRAGTPSTVALKLVRAGALKLDLGPENRGARLWLLAPGSWDPARGLGHALPLEQRPEAYADSFGRAVLRDLRPGMYDVLVKPAYEEDCFRYTQHTAAARVCPGITVSALPAGEAALEKLESVRLQVGKGGSEVRGRAVLKNLPAWRTGEKDVGRLRVTIVNEQVVGSIDFYLPDDLDPKLAPSEAGQRAKGFEMVPPEYFRMAGVPPGEYRMYLEYEIGDRRWPWRERQRFDAAARPMKTIRVTGKPVEEVEEMVIDVGAEMMDRMRRASREGAQAGLLYRYGSEEGTDIGPGFQP